MEELGSAATKRTLVRLTIKDLYGDHNRTLGIVFHHSGITVVTGDNGVGKSTALELLRCCLNISAFTQRQRLFQIAFESITVEFADGSTIMVIREDLGEARHLRVFLDGKEVHMFYEIAESQEHLEMAGRNTRSMSRLTRDFLGLPESRSEQDHAKALDRDWGLVSRFVSRTTDLDVMQARLPGSTPRFRDRRRDTYLSIGQVAEQEFADQWPANVRDALNRITGDEIPQELTEFLSNLTTVNISASRLASEVRRAKIRQGRDEHVSAMIMYQELVQDEIRKSANEYSRESIRLDREFPNGLMQFIDEFENGPVNTENQIFETEKLLNDMQNDVEAFERQMTEIGILDEPNTLTMSQVLTRARSASSFEKFLTPFLLYYYKNYELKAVNIKGFATRLLLAKDLINAKLLGKEIRISRESGFTVNQPDGPQLNPDELSSGEQHLIILYLKLLIELKPNSIVLIDEPEISWHLKWQSTFIDELRQIQEQLPSLQFIIATHSMSILGENFELEHEITMSGHAQ